MPDRTTAGPAQRGFAEVRGEAEPDEERRTDRDLAPSRTDWGLRFHLRTALPDVEGRRSRIGSA